MLRDMITLLRPKHWLKNVFVLAPIVFAWPADFRQAAWRVALAFLVFCLLSGAVYCVNDVLDREADRQHLRKRNRPVAAGRVSVRAALIMAVGLVVIALTTAAVLLPGAVLLVSVLYLVNNAAYTTVLKHHVIVDVISISLGFVLRLLAGAWAVPAVPSSWLLVCGFALSFLLALGKRRAELVSIGANTTVRASLRVYTAEKLDVLLSSAASLTLLSYMLYTVSEDTQALHGTTNLVYTTPLVAYGIFRFIFKTHEGQADGPVEILSGDLVFPAIGLAWGLSIVAILHWPI